MFNYLILVSLCLWIVAVQAGNYCPDRQLVSPCWCSPGYQRVPLENNPTIECLDIKDGDLEGVFERLRQVNDVTTYYEHLNIYKSNNLTEISNSTFKGFRFGQIYLWDNPNLTRINGDAFDKTGSTTDLSITNSPKLATLEIFDVVNKFNQVRYVRLFDLGITEIPDNAFQGLTNVWSTNINIGVNSISKLGQRAFALISGLSRLTLSTNISYIPDHAFDLDKQGYAPEIIFNQKMPIFALESLTGLKGGAKITFNYNQTDLIFDKEVFGPLLDHDKSTITLQALSLDCNDCGNQWLQDKKYGSKIYVQGLKNIVCSNHKSFDNPDNFKYCE